jgi:hypothetical protein
MRALQVLTFGMFAALLVACGAWTLAWFGTVPAPPSVVQAAPEPGSPSGTIHLNSDPQDTDATTSFLATNKKPATGARRDVPQRSRELKNIDQNKADWEKELDQKINSICRGC